MNETLQSSKFLFQRLLQIQTTNAAFICLNLEATAFLCSLMWWNIIIIISYFAKLVRNEQFGAPVEMFLSSQKKTFFFFSSCWCSYTCTNHCLTKHSGLHRLPHKHVVAIVTAVNSPVLPAVLSRALTVTSENILSLKISFIWTEFGAEL